MGRAAFPRPYITVPKIQNKKESLCLKQTKGVALGQAFGIVVELSLGTLHQVLECLSLCPRSIVTSRDPGRQERWLK